MKNLLLSLISCFVCFYHIVNAQPWVVRHDLSASQYQTEVNNWSSKGYRPTQISGYNDSFAVIFEKQINPPAWIGNHGLTSTQFKSEYNKLTQQGLRPVCISSYIVGNQVHYASIFEKRPNNSVWVSFQDLIESNYKIELDKWTKLGYKITDLSSYTNDGKDFYSVIFDKDAGANWVTKHGMTATEYQIEFNAKAQQGYRLTIVAANNGGKYAGVWEKNINTNWVAIHAADTRRYQQEQTLNYSKNYRPSWINGTKINNTNSFSAIWKFDGPFSETCGCISLNKLKESLKTQLDGKCVGYNYSIFCNGKYEGAGAGGYSRLDIDGGNKPMDVLSKVQIASMSKTITAVITLKLLSEKNLTIDEKISKYLPPDWTLGSNISKITFRQLLRHESGFRDIPGKDCTGPFLFNNNMGECSLPETSNYEYLKCKVLNGINSSDIDKFNYHSLNFQLLRVILPKLAGFNHLTTNNDSYTSQKFLDLARATLQNDSLNCYNESVYHYSFPIKNDIHGMTFGNLLFAAGGGGFFMSSFEYGNFLNNLFQEQILNTNWLNQFINLKLGCFEEDINSKRKALNHNGGHSLTWGANNINCKGAANSVWYRTDDGLIMVLEINSESPIYINNILANAYNAACDINATLNTKFNEDITFYPNPSSDVITIKTDQLDIGAVTYEISSIQGSVIVPSQQVGFEGDININLLQSGVYLLKLRYKSQYFTKKLIKL